ncbi:MAG: trypsin-like peptidase domain-containing protein [Chloroflexota bacterium]
MSDVLLNFSNGLADTVAAAGKSVVRVEARRRMSASGFVWADGVIVTAHHVVERDDNLTVGLPNGEKVSATLAGRDPSNDIAVLRIETTGLTVFAQGTPDQLRVGHLVLAVGRPGKDILATHGIVSAIGLGGQADNYLQTDVAMYPGFSGGPLVDVSGQLLGLNTSAMRDTSIAIPVQTLRRVVDTLLSHGKIRQGYLGVGAQPVKLPAGLREQLGQETGLLIASVETDSPADKGGLLLGDTLVGMDGNKVRNMEDLAGLLSGEHVGKASAAKIVRGGQVIEVNVTVGERA